MSAEGPADCPPLRLVRMVIEVCDLCLDGVGGECHVPGCAYWMTPAPTGTVLTLLRNFRVRVPEVLDR